MEEFVGHGLEEVTGTLNNPLMVKQLKQLFPNCPTRHRLARTQVDYLLGLDNRSWHPERITEVKGGGDLWLYKNRFGKCLGGSHPMVAGRIKKSAGMYTVFDMV